MAATSDEILHDFSPMLRVFKDGRIERSVQDIVPPSVDPATAVQSKDVEISPEIDLSARIFLPGDASPSNKLPLVVYFHGSGFYCESAFSPTYHKHLNHLVAEANVVALSVNYRLAPEHPLPIAYDDSFLALKWIQSGRDDWIKEFADLNRVFLGGDSTGGNIAHHMAVRIGSEKLGGVNFSGVFLNCPFFYGKDPIGNEETHERLSRSSVDKFWHFVCPSTTGCDEPMINPAMDPNLSRFGCKRVLVYVAGKDFLSCRNWYYKEALIESGWGGEIEVVEVDDEEHCFSVAAPEGENGMAMLRKVASFYQLLVFLGEQLS